MLLLLSSHSSQNYLGKSTLDDTLKKYLGDLITDAILTKVRSAFSQEQEKKAVEKTRKCRSVYEDYLDDSEDESDENSKENDIDYRTMASLPPRKRKRTSGQGFLREADSNSKYWDAALQVGKRMVLKKWKNMNRKAGYLRSKSFLKDYKALMSEQNKVVK